MGKSVEDGLIPAKGQGLLAMGVEVVMNPWFDPDVGQNAFADLAPWMVGRSLGTLQKQS